MSTAEGHRFRWHGSPGLTQPDINDVLYVVRWFEGHGYVLAGAIYRVVHARELLRGPNRGLPHELLLTVVEDSVRALDDETVERFSVVLDRSGR